MIKYKLLKKRAKSKLVSCIKQMYGNDRTLLGFATSVLDDFFKCAERVAESDVEGDEEILKAFTECIMKRMEAYGILNFYWYAGISACFDKAIEDIEVEDYR